MGNITRPEDIVNLALLRLGRDEQIENLFEGSHAAKAALAVYCRTRDECAAVFAVVPVSGAETCVDVSRWGSLFIDFVTIALAKRLRPLMDSEIWIEPEDLNITDFFKALHEAFDERTA